MVERVSSINSRVKIGQHNSRLEISVYCYENLEEFYYFYVAVLAVFELLFEGLTVHAVGGVCYCSCLCPLTQDDVRAAVQVSRCWRVMLLPEIGISGVLSLLCRFE